MGRIKKIVDAIWLLILLGWIVGGAYAIEWLFEVKPNLSALLFPLLIAFVVVGIFVLHWLYGKLIRRFVRNLKWK